MGDRPRLDRGILKVAEDCYHYGTGVLWIRVVAVRGSYEKDGRLWIEVLGVQYNSRGETVDMRRTVAIRVDRLNGAVPR